MGRGTGSKIIIFPGSVSSPELSRSCDNHFHVKNDLSSNCPLHLENQTQIRNYFRAQNQASPWLGISWAFWAQETEVAELRFELLSSGCSGGGETKVHPLTHPDT